jgi:hypothetical protein
VRTTFTLGAIALAGVAAFLYACSKDTTTPKQNPPTSENCTINPGDIPSATCGATPVCGTTTSCTTIDESKCGSKSTCLPLADNSGKSVLDFRIRRLNVIAPPALASSFVQNAVVTKNIDLSNACGDTGNGAFNWLIRIDKSSSTFTTGGAPPNGDPYGSYCFFHNVAGGIQVGPTSGKFTLNGNTLEAEPLDKLNIPIFVNGDPTNVVILPITYGTIKNVTLSPDGNCIGAFDPAALDSTCTESDNTTCSKWLSAGALGGYITLEEADAVYVADLSESLCVLLTQSSKGTDGKCQRDDNKKIKFTGDYCSTTKSPGGCADSTWMAATFAAAAVKIDDKPTRPECTGGALDGGTPEAGAIDAGTDATAASDAKTD